MSGSLFKRLLHLEGDSREDTSASDKKAPVSTRAEAIEDGKTPVAETAPVAKPARKPVTAQRPLLPRRASPELVVGAPPPTAGGLRAPWHVASPEEEEEGRRRAQEAFDTFQRQQQAELEMQQVERRDLWRRGERVLGSLVGVVFFILLRRC